jgi:hypothetical protein
MNFDLERRRQERLPLVRPCKIYEPRSEKYLNAITENLSTGGALLTIMRPLDLRPGDLVHVGVALKRRQAVIPANEMIASRVVRCLHNSEGHCTLAVIFDTAAVEQPLALAA